LLWQRGTAEQYLHQQQDGDPGAQETYTVYFTKVRAIRLLNTF
jgi:hypothetical protein